MPEFVQCGTIILFSKHPLRRQSNFFDQFLVYHQQDKTVEQRTGQTHKWFIRHL